MTCENCLNMRVFALYPGNICKKCNDELPQYKIDALIIKQNAEKKEAGEW